jgi:uncharacterized heparinase superfamily protein
MAGALGQGMKRLVFATRLYSLWLGRAAPREIDLIPPDPWPGQAERGQMIAEGIYRLAGERHEGLAPPWDAADAEEDFLATLHGFDWLRDLRAVGGDGARRVARDLVADWIDRHDRWHPLYWRPDVLGSRVANWLALHDFFCASAEGEYQRMVTASLVRQVRHLARAVPGGLQGQRLLVALKGLILGGLAVSIKDDRLIESLERLSDTLPDQILPDGGHVERNPSAALTVLRHLIDIRATLRAFRVPIPDPVQHAIDRMAPALRFFRHGDGGLALFNGASEGEAVLIDTVLGQADAKGRPLKSAVQSGYERALAGRTLMIVDVGGPPPPGLDRSAHAGLLAFELSVGRERVIVNCGAWAGGGGERGHAWHQALRATAAHSTLTLADTNQLALLEDGGVVRRGQPLRNLIEATRQEEDGQVLIAARHEGYRHGFNLVHYRRLLLSADGSDLRGEDKLAPEKGRHRGNRRVAVRFHLHPQIQVLMAQGGQAAILRTATGVGFRFRADGGDLSVEDSIYFGRGEPRRAHQLVISADTAPEGLLIQWALTRERG